jgi:hypothetical protein
MHQGGSGSRLFVVEGGLDALVLDGMYMKNVIVRNSRVIYEGGPVRLENVSFVNCTFVLSERQPVRELGDSILQATSVHFEQVGPSAVYLPETADSALFRYLPVHRSADYSRSVIMFSR